LLSLEFVTQFDHFCLQP